ncbi:hypothetical protein ACWAT4_21755 [Bradyrhizobium manausense]
MDKIDEKLRDALAQSIQAGLSDETMEQFNKKVKDLSCEFEESLMWSLKDNLAYNLSAWVVDMAERALEQMLLGNEDQMRRYLSCDKRGDDGQYICYTGRSDGSYNSRSALDQYPVIHGRLFETGAIELRKKVAQANETLIRDERIKDLEDQVKSLVEQVNKAIREKENLLDRIRRGEVVA